MRQIRKTTISLSESAEKPTFGCVHPEDRVRLGHDHADAVLCGGIKRDGLHEVFAAGVGDEAAATGFALALTARLATKAKWLLWIRQDLSALEAGEPYAAGFHAFGLAPDRMVVMQASDGTTALRAASEGLACQGVAAVLLEVWGKNRAFDLVASRKLTLAAQHSRVTPILLRFGAEPQPSAAETRWLVKTAPAFAENWDRPHFEAALVRNRRGQTGRWIMEWDSRHGCFSSAHSCAATAAAFHRPPETPVEGLSQTG